MDEKIRPLSVNQVVQKIETLDRKWRYASKSLILNLSFSDFDETVKAVNKIAKEAEKLDHHPELKIYSYNKLEVRLSTHKVKGLTEKDFDLAQKIEEVI